MPHSSFKERSHTFNSGVGKCPCGQTFDFTSERDQNTKLLMHGKFCSKKAEGSKQRRAPKKAMTLKEQQDDQTEGIRRILEH